MRAIVLAAGRGSRMGLLTDAMPKCLTKYKGKALLEWQIASLKGAGISEVAIVTGYKSEMLNSYSKKLFLNQAWQTTNMVASLICAEEWFHDDLIVSYSDIFYTKETVKSLMKSEDDFVVAYDPNWLEMWGDRFYDPLSDAESFRIDEDLNILEIGNKVTNVAEIEGQYLGLLKLSKNALKVFLNQYRSLGINEQKSIQMTSFINQLIKEGNLKIKGEAVIGQWGEIDSESDLKYYENKK
jgi:L-glutamine-phosphate cytidylyltransferase